MEQPRMQQTMPEDRNGWHEIDAGPHLEVLFHPDRRLARREPDEIERPSIVVAVTGKREQALRFDPFSMGAHYHIRPGLAPQIPLPTAEGQSPLDATMAFFEKPLRFPARALNRLLLRLAVFTPFVQEGGDNLRRWERRFHGRPTPASRV